MPAGRPATPTPLKVLQGNPGKRRLNSKEPKVQRGVPPCPAHLDAIGKAFWRSVAQLLDAMRVLTLADGRILELAADAYSEWRRCRKAVQEHGPTYRVETETGYMIRARPEVAMAADAWRRLSSALAQLGLTPATRSKLQALGDDPVDPLEDFLRG